jgi:sugar phosphate isomerase/epimerase
MLDVSPPEWVQLVAEARFEAVGIRIGAASPSEEPWPISTGSPMLAETLQRLDDTGVFVQDVEIITITPETRADEHEHLFETGARLGARFFNVMVMDPDVHRAHDTFADLCRHALPFRLRPCMEGISYTAVRDLETAVEVLNGTGGGLIVDPLHIQRSGDDIEDLRRVETATLGYLQLCDGPLEVPTGIPRPARMPRGQPFAGSDKQLEARAARLLPGDGEIPVADFVAVLPADLPVSIEAPNLELTNQLGRLGFLRRARESAARVLAAARSAEPTPT